MKATIYVVIAIIVAGVVWLQTWIFHWAWQLIAVDVFHWPSLTMWQCFAFTCVLSLIGSYFKSSRSK